MTDMQAIEANIRALRGPILVTGASGFIGANLFKLIAEVRSDVYAVVMREKNWRLAEMSDEQVIALAVDREVSVVTEARKLVAHDRHERVLRVA